MHKSLKIDSLYGLNSDSEFNPFFCNVYFILSTWWTHTLNVIEDINWEEYNVNCDKCFIVLLSFRGVAKLGIALGSGP